MKKKTIALILVIIAVVAAVYYLESGKAIAKGNANDKISSNGDIKINEKTIVEFNPNDNSFSPYQRWEQSLTQEDKKRISQKEQLYTKVPELSGISGYLNADPGLKIEDFRGKVVLVDFWTYTCINCIRTFPYLTEWDRKYRDDGLVIIGVHTPEFEFEKEYDNVLMAIKKYGIEYRVVQDNDYATWKAFKNRYWPRKYLIDADGFIRYDHIGEGGYTKTEKNIQELLMEQGVHLDNMSTTQLEDKTPKRQLTPELYAGYGFALPRGQNIGNTGGLRSGVEFTYTLNAKLESNIMYLDGLWEANEDNLGAKEGGAAVYLVYTAGAVNIVAKAEVPAKLFVTMEGKPLPKEFTGSDVNFDAEGKSYVLIDEPRLYNLISGDHETALLTLTAEKAGLSFNAFTFG